MIHKTYSKADLIEIINVFKLKLPVSLQNERKNFISVKISSYIECIKNPIDFSRSSELFDECEERNDLIVILRDKNPYKKLSVKQKNNVMYFCKEVIHFCNHGYLLENTHFNTMRDIENFMDEIQSYGDIPSVRRACKLMNLCSRTEKKWTPVISVKVIKAIQDKQNSKVKKVNYLISKQGKFFVNFD